MVTRICMWSGPRNLSTAMMRSFDARADCAVMDEPFFAPFLDISGKAHPGRAETLATHETKPQTVAMMCETPALGGASISFQKHMPHHMLDGFPLKWTRGARHFFLIRHPARVIASYAKGRAEFTAEDLGYGQLVSFYEFLSAEEKGEIPILDCDDILAAPAAMLTALCANLGVSFDPAMLQWEKGPRVTDGAWAPYWYKSVENSTGFAPPPRALPDIAPAFATILQQAMPYYTAMFEKRLQA